MCSWHCQKHFPISIYETIYLEKKEKLIALNVLRRPLKALFLLWLEASPCSNLLHKLPETFHGEKHQLAPISGQPYETNGSSKQLLQHILKNIKMDARV